MVPSKSDTGGILGAVKEDQEKHSMKKRKYTYKERPSKYFLCTNCGERRRRKVWKPFDDLKGAISEMIWQQNFNASPGWKWWVEDKKGKKFKSIAKSNLPYVTYTNGGDTAGSLELGRHSSARSANRAIKKMATYSGCENWRFWVKSKKTTVSVAKVL